MSMALIFVCFLLGMTLLFALVAAACQFTGREEFVDGWKDLAYWALLSALVIGGCNTDHLAQDRREAEKATEKK